MSGFSETSDGSAPGLGFIGTGAMGTEMVLRLLAAGHTVTVSNRRRANAARAETAGAAWADQPCDIAASSDAVLSCLLDGAAVEHVYLGEGGLLEAARPGQLFVEHGTFSPELAREVHRRLAEVGAHFVDMPVTGGPAGTRAGRLAAMAGGDTEAVERAAAIAGAYCAKVSRIGSSGAGLHLKLVNQLLVSGHMAAAAEAVALLQRVGIDLSVAGPVLESGWAASAMLNRTLAQLAAGETQHTGVKTGGMIEIQQLIEQLLGQTADYPVFAGSRAVFERALAVGLGEADPAAMHLAIVGAAAHTDSEGGNAQ